MDWIWLVVGLGGCTSGGEPTVDGDRTDDGTDDGTVGDDDDATDDDTAPPTGPVGIHEPTWALVDGYASVVRVGWVQDGAATVHVEYSFDDGVWSRSPDRTLGTGPHEELLLGVPFAHDVTWRIVAAADGDEVRTPELDARTGDAPALAPLPELLTYDAARVDAATTHVLVAVNEGETNSTGSWTLLVDRQGRVSWAHRSPEQRHTMHPRVTWDHDGLLVDHSSFFTAFDGGAASEILELKLDGTVVRTWDTPGQHHAFTDLPDGSLAYAQYQGAAGGGQPDDDAIVVIDPSGTPRQLFGCAGFVPGPGSFGDYCGSNTLSYDPTLDVFLFSLFTHDSVVEVDAVTGEANRWFGRIAGSWAFSPPESMFDYQHGAVYLDNGNLLLSTHSELENTELAVREYALDEADETLVEVWSAGVGLGVTGRQKGEAHRLPGGNTLQNYGTHAVIREFTPEGDVVWDLRWEDAEYGNVGHHGMGRSAPVQVDLYAFAPERR